MGSARPNVTTVVVAAALAVAADAGAQSSLTFVPSVSFAGVYDGNVFARAEGSAGQMLQVRPSLESSFKSSRVTFLSLYSFDMLRSNHADLNTLDARRHAMVDTTFRPAPRTSVALATRYDRTETPGELNLDSGVLSARLQAQRWQVSPSFTHRIGIRRTVSGGYDWTSENLVDTEQGTLHSARAGLSQEVSTRTTLTASYVARYFVSGSDAHTSHALLAGWTRQLSDSTRVALQAGPRIASSHGPAPEIVAGLARITPRSGVALDYWRGETIVLGIRGPVAINGATGRFTWPVRRVFSFGAIAGISDITTLEKRDAKVYRGTLVGSWTPRGMVTMAASYGVDYQQGDVRRSLFAGQDVLRHVVRVSMTIAPRLSRSSLPPDEAARAKGVFR